ncbi:MAG TPA: DUF2177 family protein [Acidisoma sp.]|jgi:uncharacterized membrane protein|uniref:DUF2177 family protein n=1 Tax=Acidisoma sp. TaxID=1872115 RepID=UPI002CC0B78C|nr:DUF2177 family protein [Acidisoma sp.]HTI03637.1 DUF2177 family protein [Acidisoma sp.]
MPVVAYIAALLVFLALDLIWFAVMGQSYRSVLGPMLAPNIRWGAAALFYLLDILGLMIFVMLPGRRRGALWVLAHGALFGLFTYATYDLTNLAVIKGWTAVLTLQDVIWGMVASSIASIFGWALMRDRARRRR